MRRERGFSFVELTLSIIIIGVLLAGAMLPLQHQVENRKLDEAQFALDYARETLLQFAATYGYLPCPADASSGWVEVPTADHQTGDCQVWHGFLPAGFLGMSPVSSDGYLIDPWGSASGRLRYAVARYQVAAVTMPFTRVGGMAAAGVPSVGAQVNLFHVCSSGNGVTADTSCAPGETLASNVVAVVWSPGRNAGAGGGTSAHEAENPNPVGGTADRIFVSRTHSTLAGAEFDDMLTWISAPTAVARLMATGQLP